MTHKTHRKIYAIVLFSFFFLFFSTSNVPAITTDGAANVSRQAGPADPASQKKGKTYFLSFDGIYFHTTAGTIYAPSIRVINHTKTDLLKLSTSTPLHEVRFTLEDGSVTQAEILP